MNENRRGVLLGIAAYGMWGLFPLYFPLLKPAGAGEILIHRCLWSLACVVLVLSVKRHWAWVRPLLADRRRLLLLTAAAIAVATNWGVYIWGVNSHHVVETALGYYINPLITVLLGVLVLHERLPLTGWVAVGLAAAAVGVLTISYGRLPYIALILAVTFATYGFLKKHVNAPALEGLTVETGVLAGPALIALVILTVTGRSTFGDGAGHSALLAGAGVITAIPLLCFGAAATRVSLTTMGILQYLTPTLQFLVGVLIQHEPLPTERLVGCCLIWLALAVFTAGNVHYRRSLRRQSARQPAGDLGDALVGGG
jgi:chloramphenicol-sensitive protein RarD